MKKTIALLLCLATLFCFVACKADPEPKVLAKPSAQIYARHGYMYNITPENPANNGAGAWTIYETAWDNEENEKVYANEKGVILLDVKDFDELGGEKCVGGNASVANKVKGGWVKIECAEGTTVKSGKLYMLVGGEFEEQFDIKSAVIFDKNETSGTCYKLEFVIESVDGVQDTIAAFVTIVKPVLI